MKRKDPAMGELGYERFEHDFYPTPAWCTVALLKHFTPLPAVWEPACGEGHISKLLELNCSEVVSSDLIDRGLEGAFTQDFLTTTKLPKNVRSIITNPPYSETLPQQFIEKAVSLLEPVKGRCAFLLRNEFDCAAGRTRLFKDLPFSKKLVLTKRPKWIEGSTGSPRHNYAWFCWDWEHTGSPTITWGQ